MEAKKLIWKVMAVNRGHRRTVEKKIAGLGIHPSQHHVLMYLSCNGASTQSSIAAAMEVSAATIAVSLKKLEKGKYIEKQVDPEDNRFNRIVLTERGEDVVAQSKQIFEETDSTIFEGFSEGDKEQLHSLLERMLQNMKKMEES